MSLTIQEVTLMGLLAGAALLVLYVFMGIVDRRKRYVRMPPGDPPVPFVGNGIPDMYPWRHFYDESRLFGSLMTVWRGRTPMVVCSSVATAEYFLEHRARDTADRPRMILLEKAVSANKRILTIGDNEHWGKLRRAFHNVLQPAAARDLRPVQERLARAAVLDILADPARFQDHIATYAASLVVHMAYGRKERARYSDADIREIVVISERIGTLHRPGAFMIDTFPWLKYWPGYLTKVHRWAEEELALYRRAHHAARDRWQKGELPPCFASYVLENQQRLGMSDDQVSYALGAIFAAGSDTTSAAITVVVMAAACHPDQQKRVQAELDRVFNGSALSFDDLTREACPQLHAFIAECARWRPVSAGGFAHRSTADIAWGEYVIPRGTQIVGNHWAIHRDGSYYGPNVEQFRMDRWLLQDGTFDGAMKHYQFGFGRRICPGEHVATNSLLINTALLLWSFDIGKCVDERGIPIEIDTLAFTNTANSHPLPFRASFVPRYADLQELMSEGECDVAQK